MKLNKVCFGLMASGLALAGLTQSCVSDQPFGIGDGEGTLRMQLVVNTDVTRAAIDDEDLRSACVVYISNPKGLLYKYQGLENLPSQLRLPSDNYVAEAWTGDSVPASFDKKFFRGYERFAISAGDNKAVVVNCRISNVVVSLNPATVDLQAMKDWKITVSNSSEEGSLVFDESNMDYAKGYFMMPNKDIATDADGNRLTDADGFFYYTNLKYRIEGTSAEGKAFVKEGLIGSPRLDGDRVQRAHEYVLNLKYDPTYEETGGAFVSIIIDDSEVEVKDEVTLYSAPAVKGVGFDIEHQIVGNAGQFSDCMFKITAFGGIKNLFISSAEDAAALNLPHERIDLLNATEAVQQDLRNLGLKWDYMMNDERNLATSYLTLSAGFLNAVAERDSEYHIELAAVDAYGKETVKQVRLAVGEGAIVIDDPVTITPVADDNIMAVLTNSATISGTINSDDAVNPGIEYRESGTSAWTFVPAAVTRASRQFTVTLTGLKPATRYEYRAVAEGFEPSESMFLTTEGAFMIPNASMEEWSEMEVKTMFSTSMVPIPGAGGVRTFWDTGNHGAANANTTLTQGSTVMFHSGAKSAQLVSKKAALMGIGKHAAGNLFVGEYLGTNGTNGRISFGRPYDGSHPSALKLWANYRTAKVTAAGGGLTKSDMDHGQIYVAFTTAPMEVNTADTSTLFSPDKEEVLGYGEVTWAGVNFGPDGQLEELTIPVVWNEKAKTNKPLYLIIVCSASKFGDFFAGGEGATMYVDDFELVY